VESSLRRFTIQFTSGETRVIEGHQISFGDGFAVVIHFGDNADADRAVYLPVFLIASIEDLRL
jgi:hypothetical protein